MDALWCLECSRRARWRASRPRSAAIRPHDDERAPGRDRRADAGGRVRSRLRAAMRNDSAAPERRLLTRWPLSAGSVSIVASVACAHRAHAHASKHGRWIAEEAPGKQRLRKKSPRSSGGACRVVSFTWRATLLEGPCRTSARARGTFAIVCGMFRGAVLHGALQHADSAHARRGPMR